MPNTSIATQQQITSFLDTYIYDWPRDPYDHGFGYYSFDWYQDPVATSTSPEAVATDLLSNAEFRALQLGTWLNTPDGELITAAAEAISPPPYRQDIQLITEALKLAARTQRSSGIRRARAILSSGALAVVLTALIATSKN